jgi:DNA topoisomerase-1
MSAKEFRTLHASALAGEALAAMPMAASATARRRQMADVARQVAELLRNTPAISRQSYIAPCLFRLFDAGRLGALWNATAPARRGLLQREQRLGAVLAAMQ